LTYLLGGPIAKKIEDPIIEKNLTEQTGVVFCIDTSGSMSCGKPVQGKLQLKTRNLNYFDNSKDTTYVTRLECMQAAVEAQMVSILNATPLKKVGLVRFGSKVNIIGDGVHSDTIPDSVLNRYDGIMEYIQAKRGVFLNNSISESSPRLTEILIQLKTSGGTALGPALLTSVMLASEAGRGSKVIICTDGLANEGIGSLSHGSDNGFYKEVASIATQLRVIISVISIEGQECRLESLAIFTEETGGNIVKVAPETLADEFASMISEDVIATSVTVQVFLHKAIKFHMEPRNILSLKGSKMNKIIGNATASSSFSFNYALKPDSELAELGINKLDIISIPFQALFRYTALDGRKNMKAIAKVQPVTFNKEEVKQDVNIDILARRGRKRAVQLAEEGKLEEAKQDANMWKGLLKQEAKDENHLIKAIEFENDVEELGQNIDNQLLKEQNMGILNHHLQDEEKAKRRTNYADNLIVEMSKIKKKK
jgi:hypothetical protein